MRHIFVRPARPADAEKFKQWSLGTKQNLHDPDVALYPSTTTRCAFDSSGPIVFVPFQRPIMLDALAINPESDKVSIAVALKELTQDAVSTAYNEGRGEVYFFCSEPLTQEFCQRHGYIKMEVPVYRMKVSNLEKK